MIGVALIIFAIVYAAGAIVWAVIWIAVWDMDDRDNPEAARNALLTPAWPLPALQLAAQTIADLHNDAKERP